MDEWKSVHTDSCVPVRCKGPSTQDIAKKPLGKITFMHLLVINLCQYHFYQFQTDV